MILEKSKIATIFIPFGKRETEKKHRLPQAHGWVCVCVCVCVLSHVWFFATLWTVAHQTALFMGFSRQEYWSGLPFPSPGDLPQPGIKPMSPTLASEFFTIEPPEKPLAHSCVFGTDMGNWYMPLANNNINQFFKSPNFSLPATNLQWNEMSLQNIHSMKPGNIFVL